MIHGLAGEPLAIPVGDGGDVALVDEADFWVLADYAWFLMNGYACAWIDGRGVLMHRIVAAAPSGLQTDHINGDTLDNRRANLRVCTVEQNHANRRKPRHHAGRPTTSRYKGVMWVARESAWVAHITVSGQRAYLGRFSDESAAARAYDDAARKHFGAFARVNFPHNDEQSALDAERSAA